MATTKIDTVLFDIGGVLYPDTMQNVFYTREVGLIDRLGLDWRDVFAKMVEAYRELKHVRESTEEAYWEDLSERLGTSIPLDLVHEIGEKVLKPNPQAEEALSMLKKRGLCIGIVSNNTDFWYREAAKVLNLDAFIEKELVFLSHHFAVSKPIGLFEEVVKSVEPGSALFLDDRSDNVYVANFLGFRAMQYSMNTQTSSLMETLEFGLAE